MKTLDFAKKYIRFDKTSPVTGPFRIEMYPFLAAPLNASDDIRVKRLVILKASSCLGTVAGQIINAKRIAEDVGDQIMVCQTDDDAEKFTKTRGKEWLESVPNVMRLLSGSKYAQTNSLWLFRHKFLIITGPGLSAAQSDQVRYVQTDESHLPTYPMGRLVEFEKRMGARWDRQATHITTAANEGREVDQFYYQASQNEWHWRCTNPSCEQLIWPLWEDDAKERYNGEKVFRWTEHQSDTMTMDSIHAVCPWCQHLLKDNARDRYALQRGAAYVSMNPSAPIEFASYRWSALSAGHWIPWREMLSEYLSAIVSWKFGKLEPFEDWEKKRLCKTWVPRPPSLGDGANADSHTCADAQVWVTEQPQLRVCSFDVQDEDGFHLWAQADVFDRSGASRRLAYAKLDTWQQARDFQKHHLVSNLDTYCDAGHRMREVFGRCEEWGWYALFADDADSFIHMITVERGKPKIAVQHPYSMTNEEDAFSGKSGRPKRSRYLDARGRPLVAPGYCVSRRWSKYEIGGYLMAAKAGDSHSYGIARDIHPEFNPQLNSYAYVTKQNKNTGAQELVLKQVRQQDHAFATSSMNIVGAIIRGCYPLSETKIEKAA